MLVTHEHRPAGPTWSNEELQTGLNRIYRLILRENRAIPPELIASLRVLPEVSFARLGAIGAVELPRSLTLGRRQPDQASRDAVLLPEAHRMTLGDEEIVVAVLDTGISPEHPELNGRLLPGFDFVHIIDGAERFLGDHLDMDLDASDEHVGHGTHVAGIVAGRGVAMPKGVAPRCKILPVRTLGAMREGDRVVGAGLVDNINDAIKWAVDQGAQVINLSLGVPHEESAGPPYEAVIRYAQSKNVTVVAASGNSGSNEVYFPAALPHVISVGAVDREGQVAAFSSFGNHVDLVAPGSEIYSSFLGRTYAYSSGTSQAAPFVSGAAALLYARAKARGRRLRDRQIKYLLRHSADRVDRRHRHPKAGFGRLNVRDALRLLDHKLG